MGNLYAQLVFELSLDLSDFIHVHVKDNFNVSLPLFRRIDLASEFPPSQRQSILLFHFLALLLVFSLVLL